MHKSVATIDSPEFLNLQPLDINPLMSKCDIKVFYLGENRNHSYISEQVAIEIGKNLRGAPIVGYYKQQKEDFRNHGEKIIIDDQGIKFECQTVPYGFVSPDAKVWLQNFEDFDEMGHSVVHRYLMTTGYLWTEQFPQASLPIDEGRPQSMEFHKKTLKGQWQQNIENGMDFFIISDAIVQKICILGDDIEPCFEGSSITASNTNYTLDDKFRQTLFAMMQDLKYVLNKGEDQMEDEKVITTFENQEEDTSVEQYKKEEEKDSDTKEETSDDNKSSDKEDTPEEEKKEDSKEKKEKEDKYSLLESKFDDLKESFEKLQSEYSALQSECNELKSFKESVESKEKDALIAEFYMLSDADKRDVIENKSKYSLDEIKSKLSVICFDKKINFSLDTNEKQEEDVTTYSLDSTEDNFLPDWVKAVKAYQN